MAVHQPFLHPAKSPEEFNTSTKEWYNNVVADKGGKTDEQLANIGSGWVDVRDLAVALTKALSVAEAANERIIVSAGEPNSLRFSAPSLITNEFRKIPLAGLA